MEPSERRSHPRFVIPDHILTVRTKDNQERMCRIDNIGMGGMAMRCFDADVVIRDTVAADIYAVREGIVLRNLTYKTVYEKKKLGYNPFSTVVTTVAGVRFNRLTGEHFRQMKSLLNRRSA
jgi:hypothetical protein